MAHMMGARLPLALKGARLVELAPWDQATTPRASRTFAMRQEMALTLEDVVMRRTAIGQFGRPASDMVESIAEAMAEELGWSEKRKMREVSSLDPIYRTVS